MKFELNEYHRNVPDKDLIADLKKVSKELSKEAITQDEYSEFQGRVLNYALFWNSGDETNTNALSNVSETQ